MTLPITPFLGARIPSRKRIERGFGFEAPGRDAPNSGHGHAAGAQICTRIVAEASRFPDPPGAPDQGPRVQAQPKITVQAKRPIPQARYRPGQNGSKAGPSPGAPCRTRRAGDAAWQRSSAPGSRYAAPESAALIEKPLLRFLVKEPFAQAKYLCALGFRIQVAGTRHAAPGPGEAPFAVSPGGFLREPFSPVRCPEGGAAQAEPTPHGRRQG